MEDLARSLNLGVKVKDRVAELRINLCWDTRGCRPFPEIYEMQCETILALIEVKKKKIQSVIPEILVSTEGAWHYERISRRSSQESSKENILN